MAQKTTLARGKVQTVADLLLKSSADTAKKCRITLKEVQTITDIVCGELEQPPQPLSEAIGIGEGVFTTGDAAVDACLGGGIRTGMLWEICGENNAGKSQLAMQLALSVQLPVSQHGLEGSAYYICSRGQLHTERIHQILQDHPDLPSRLCSLDSIQTALSRGYLVLTRILNEILARPITGPLTAKPPRLIVIDTFSDYFDATKDPQYENNPALRAQHLRAIALLLHRIATKHALALSS
ncbi:P-loop containing nucleoside triphosphate hydrolase protein [Epithele typhae]|uniref:P-loop containing nucleoside triphosphate hydrolase protein n=1 Tax=Epithele typhae TaxID=378194 RepID=UPI0020078F98|nr:P-loop containing nucleoside triphosphate hydrolase protein [Epithele typhae]KAH9946299.1 P-loop containing nucleoside triphosphate hydrolase protein [Epithele typhae]